MTVGGLLLAGRRGGDCRGTGGFVRGRRRTGRVPDRSPTVRARRDSGPGRPRGSHRRAAGRTGPGDADRHRGDRRRVRRCGHDRPVGSGDQCPRTGRSCGSVPRRLPHRQPADRRRPPQRGHRLRRARHRRPGLRPGDRLHLLSAGSRAAFRAALGTDDATWIRGHGWALATAPNACTYCAAVNPRVAAQTTRQITEALIGQVSGAKAYHSTGCAGRVPGGALDGLAGHRGKGLFKRFAGVMSDSARRGRRRPGCSARRGGAGSGRRAVPARRQPGCPPGSRAQRWWAPSCAGAVRRRGPDA